MPLQRRASYHFARPTCCYSAYMANSPIREDPRLLTVPTVHDGASIRGRPTGLRSRSPSPASSSRSPSPTLHAARTPSPVISGGPYLRSRCPSAVSLHKRPPVLSPRPYHSANTLGKYPSASSISVHVESAHSFKEDVALADYTAEPTHATAPPAEDSADVYLIELQGVSPIDVEDTKYTPRRRSVVLETTVFNSL